MAVEIKLVTEPSVRLVTKQELLLDSLQGFLDEVGGGAEDWASDASSYADAIPEVAGRVCYLSFSKPRPGGNAAYLQHIKDVAHGSVLEHSVFGFILSGVSRSLSHELVRHRAGFGFSQLSQRYVDESEVRFVVPPELLEGWRLFEANQHWGPDGHEKPECVLYARWEEACAQALGAYTDLVDGLSDLDSHRGELSVTERRKIVRQTARSVLPNATETMVFVTANARAWRHFIEQRCSRHADAEIRRLAHRVWQVLVTQAPGLFGDYQEVRLPDGSFELTTPYPKV